MATAFLYGVLMKKLYVLLLDLALVSLGLMAAPMTGWMFDVIPDCPATKLGLLCPSCGGTRCVRAFFSGDFLEAFGYNPFIFLLVLYLGAALALLNVGVLMKIEWAEKTARSMTGWQAVIICAVLFAIFGVTRNFL